MGRVTTVQNRENYPIGTGKRGMSQRDISIASAEQGAIADFSDVVGQIATAEGRKIMQADYQAQFVAGGADIDNLWRETVDSFRENQDESTYGKVYKDFLNKAGGIASATTNRKSRRELEAHIQSSKAVWNDKIRDEVYKRKTINGLSDADRMVFIATNQRDLSDPLELDEAEGLIRQAAEIRIKFNVPEGDVATMLDLDYKNLFTKQIFQQAQAISAAQGYEKAVKWVMDGTLDPDEKKKIVRDIEFEASQQKLEYDKYVEKTEQDLLVKERLGTLTDTEILNSQFTADKKREWLRYYDAMVEERLSGEVELNWESYDKLQSMVEDYDTGKIDKEEVQEAISKEVGKTIPTTIARSLRDRLATKDKPDDPLNKSSAKRALSILNELKTADFFWPEDLDDDDPEGKRQNLLNYLDVSKEFEEYLIANPDATDEQINDKIDTLTQPYIENKAKGTLDKLWDFWVQSPFGVGYRKIAGIEKEGEELPEPMSIEDFEDTVRGLDEEEAKAYYEKWKNKW